MGEKGKNAGGRHRLRRVISMLLILVLAGGAGYLIGAVSENIRLSSLNRAVLALEKTGLPTEAAPPHCLYGYTGFRDSFAITEFVVEYEQERTGLLQAMKSVSGWHIAPVNAADWRQFADTAMWSYADVIQLPEDIVFDAWYYLETSAPASFSVHAPEGALAEIGQVGRGFELAVFDAETGLFVLVDQFG